MKPANPTPLNTGSTRSLQRDIARSLSQGAIYHGILARTRYKVFKKLLWKLRRCVSKVILESNVTPNRIRSSDSFRLVSPTFNGCDWGCIMHDLETIIVLALLTFNLIPQSSHQALTLPRSLISHCNCNSTAWGWNNSHQSGIIIITDRLIFQNEKRSNSTGGTTTGPKHFPAALLTPH